MLLNAGPGERFFGEAPWWVFPLVGIPMMLVMMLGMGFMMWFMMRMMMPPGGSDRHQGGHGASQDGGPAGPGEGRPTPLDIARERLARGEITEEEFLRLKQHLS